jgi:hypothetical protein
MGKASRGDVGKRKGEGRTGGAHVKADEKKGKNLRCETGLAKYRRAFWICLMELDV